ncbi:MAG: SDR family oxidoreductase [Lachnospiraceae bacterium]|nr:SDR family oxidoreductase [Lachnospiraceae bacterium]
MKECFCLEGKVAAITGGSSGIGKEVAQLFRSQGAYVVLLGINQDELQAAKAEIGGQADVFALDIGKENQVKEVFEKIAKAHGTLDILVNCAGIFAPGKVGETDFSQWQKIMNVNLDGAFLCSKYAIPLMQKNGRGSIVNIASEAGLAAIAGQTAYNVSKAAMISLSQCMAVDYALENIRVNCVCPGRVLTPLVQNIIDSSADPQATLIELSSDRPLMKMGNPRDIAYACLHFANDSMPYATGAVLSVDGAYTAR